MNWASTEPVRPSFSQALRFWWKLGWTSFGGPAGQIAIMHSELVERRRWVDEETFLHGLNYCMLLPGPEAMQLATYLGWRMHGARGGLAAGVLFVLPGALLIAGLAWVYLRFGRQPTVAGALLGIQAAVLAILAQALFRIGRRVLRTPLAVALAASALMVIAFWRLPFPLILVGAAVIGVLAEFYRPGWSAAPGGTEGAVVRDDRRDVARPWPAIRMAIACLLAWWLPLLAVAGWLGVASTAFAQALFFSKAALVTFGGAYAVLPYVARQAVETHQWLLPEQMLVGLGFAETTPGPLILVLEFVGFVGGWQHPDLGSALASALLGAGVALWATFAPCFLFVLPVAPWIERLREWSLASAALSGITAAVVGVMAHLAQWFGRALIENAEPVVVGTVLAVATTAWYALARLRANVAWVVLVAAIAGALLRHVLGA